MTRTVAREIAIHFAFELGFSNESAQACLDRKLKPEVFSSLAEEEPLYGEFPNQKQMVYIRHLVCGVGEHGAELDAYIERYAVGWRFARISKVAAAIMRVAMFELLYMPEVPPAAAINEAVELSKSYEPAEVTSFINGILGTFWREEGKALSVLPGGQSAQAAQPQESVLEDGDLAASSEAPAPEMDKQAETLEPDRV
jgi:N utilization substance protein B